jgi:hypothetical protein
MIAHGVEADFDAPRAFGGLVFVRHGEFLLVT